MIDPRLQAALPALRALLAAPPLSLQGAVDIERQFDAGQSNPTYLLRVGDRRVVLRKQPYGRLLPKAHDVLRECRIMQALSQAGFAVPQPLLSSAGSDAIGTDFFVMEYVAGTVASDPALPNDSPENRGTIYRTLARRLTELHALDPAILAAAGVNRRPDFLGRQIAIWQSHYAASTSEPDLRIDTVARWLLDNRPSETQDAIVHGDYRIENLILQGTEIAAVLDWELCAIGAPLADLAYCCIWYHLPHAALNGLADLNLSRLGIPEERQFIACYREGLTPADLRYFMAFAFYRLAAILQGVYRRALDGNAASPHALSRGAIARLCLDRAESFAS